jgi:hypothetical protein
MEDAEDDGWKVVQGQFNNAFWKFDSGLFDAEPDAKSLGGIAGDEVEAAEFEAGQPFHAALTQGGEEGVAHGIAAGEGNKRHRDAFGREEVGGVAQAELFGSQERHVKFTDRGAIDAAGGFTRLHGKAKVDFLGVEQLLDLGLACFGEAEPEVFILLLEAPEQGGEVFALDQFGSRDAEQRFGAAGDAGLQQGQAGKEGLDELVQGFTFAGKSEGAAMEKGDAESGFELEDLGADGGLLDAVGDVASGSADPFVMGDVIKEFEVVDIHKSGE